MFYGWQLLDVRRGNIEEQAIETFSSFRQKLEAECWSLSDIVQVRAFPDPSA